MNLVDEEDVALLEIGQQGGEITRLGDHRAGCRAETDAHLLGHDLREGRLAETRGPREQHMVERVAPPPGGLDEYAEIAARGFLADEIVERLRTDRRLEGIGFLPDARDQPALVGVAHRTHPVRGPALASSKPHERLGRARRFTFVPLALYHDLPRRRERRSHTRRAVPPPLWPQSRQMGAVM